MKQEAARLDDLILVGITVRTNNKNEINPATSKIGETAGLYWSNQVANEFKFRKNRGVTYSVYTDFESDEHGDYTYFIGEAVSSAHDQDFDKFRVLTIPAGAYQKIKNNLLG